MALVVRVQARQWSDDTGQFKIEADFVALSGDKVQLKKQDGKVIEIPLARLSTADKQFVETQRNSKATDPFTTAVEVPAPPVPAKPEQTVLAEGVGTTRQEALKDAFRNAVRQVVGAVLDAETLVKDDKIIDDKVLTNSDGIIGKGYEELEEKNEGGLVRVKIRASVQRGTVIARLKAANVTTQSIDGKSLFAEAATKLESHQTAAEMLEKAFALAPSGFLTAEVKGKPTVSKGADGRVAMTYTLTVKGDFEKYDQWQKKVTPLLEQIASAKGETFLVASPIKNPEYRIYHFASYFNDYDHYKKILQADRPLHDAVIKQFLSWDNSDINAGRFYSVSRAVPDHRSCIWINTARNKLCDRTTWKWFYVESDLVKVRPIAVDVFYLDQDGKEITRDVIEFSYNIGPGYELDESLAVLSPFWYQLDDLCYSASVSFPQTLEVSPDELESIATTKCVIRARD